MQLLFLYNSYTFFYNFDDITLLNYFYNYLVTSTKVSLTLLKHYQETFYFSITYLFQTNLTFVMQLLDFIG